MFGLPGEVRTGTLNYVAMGNRAGLGWKRRGEHLGWKYRSEQHAEFRASVFAFAAAAIGKDNPTEGERRAILGLQLASRAILEHRPPLRLLTVVMAAETLLLDGTQLGQSRALAQRSAYLLCARHEQVRCGRELPTCLVLGLSPDVSADAKDIGLFRDRGNADDRWRCSEWHRVLDWYGERSKIVHRGADNVDEKEASRALWWLTHDLLPVHLEWLHTHPDHPVEDLRAVISALPATPDRQALHNGGYPADGATRD
jgi:hypothetical protein